jgi:nucleotide-binding universal stress UspA family protein
MGTLSAVARPAAPAKGPRVWVREVLFPSDLSPESDRAFEHARFLAERFEASLTLYHGVEVPDPLYAHWAFAHGDDVWRRAERSAHEQLERRAEGLSVSHPVIVERTASAPRALCAFIRETQPDLTVMATHGRSGLAHLLLGSVTEDVICRAFRPILCVREPEAGAALPYRRILVPTDMSLASRLAFPIAALFARTFGAEVLALHVVPSTTAASLSGVPPVQAVSIPSEAALWKFFQVDFAGLGVTAQVHSGSVWERICKAAEVERADLIVMSTHGHDSLSDRVLGSNTDRVVRHARCPVLVA